MAGEVIELHKVRDQRAAERHARALVLFECAATLARRQHPGLIRLIEESFGHEWLEDRVRDTATPTRATGGGRAKR